MINTKITFKNSDMIFMNRLCRNRTYFILANTSHGNTKKKVIERSLQITVGSSIFTTQPFF